MIEANLTPSATPSAENRLTPSPKVSSTVNAVNQLIDFLRNPNAPGAISSTEFAEILEEIEVDFLVRRIIELGYQDPQVLQFALSNREIQKKIPQETREKIAHTPTISPTSSPSQPSSPLAAASRS